MTNCRACGCELRTRFAQASDPQTNDVFSVLECIDCGFGQTSPQPADLGRHYADYYGGRHGFTARFRAKRRLGLVEQFSAPKGSSLLLDVGCGEGTFLAAARDKGLEVVGTELDAQRLSDLPFEVFSDLGKVKEKFGPATFDAVTLWHTLEHFRDPRRVLEDVTYLLADDGVVLIAVPNALGAQARLFGRNWLHLDVPRHLFHFGTRPLDLLLRQTGFRVTDVRHQEFEYDLLGYSQSALNKIFEEPNVFFRTLSGHEVKVSRTTKLANFVLGLAFSAVAMPLVFFNSLAKSGGTLVVAARKDV